MYLVVRMVKEWEDMAVNEKLDALLKRIINIEKRLRDVEDLTRHIGMI